MFVRFLEIKDYVLELELDDNVFRDAFVREPLVFSRDRSQAILFIENLRQPQTLFLHLLSPLLQLLRQANGLVLLG